MNAKSRKVRDGSLARAHILAAAIVAIVLTSTARAEPRIDYDSQLAERRSGYITWIIDTFGALEPSMDPRDGRRWALNHARLVLDRDLEKANHYFESFGPMRRDADIYFIRYLRTLLDFRDSPRLSEGAKAHLIDMLQKKWSKQPAPRAHNLPNHTENHELMNLTLVMFAEQSRGGDISTYVNWIKQTLAWRFERGWVEFNSRCYQYHYSNPLIVLVDYAPDEDLRRGAEALLNVMLAERALLSVNGYLAGPSFRCREADAFGSLTARKTAYLVDARYDGFLPIAWMAFGMGEPRFDFANARVPGLEPATIHIATGNEPRLKQDEAMFLACSTFRVHPIVRALAEEAKTRKFLIYNGQRYLGWPNDWSWKTQRWLPGAIYYYNTPHVSMGSVHSDGAILQSRYNTILFGADPSQGLRVEIFLPDVPPNKRRYETRGRVVQHKNWMLGQGTLYEDGGAKSQKVGRWNVYRVGRGLCAHMELPDSYHVLQVSDLDTYADEGSFVEALSVPEMKDQHVGAVTMDGDRIAVDLSNMSISINDAPRPHPPKMLHDCEWMKSEFGSGRITIHAAGETLTLDRRTFYDGPTDTPQSGELMTVEGAKPAGPLWGNATNTGRVTTANHVRALGGKLRLEGDIQLKSVSVALPWQSPGSIRIAVYAGGDLAAGPHVDTRARLVHDFGKTAANARGWVTLEVPGEGVLMPAGSVVWIAWKGQGGLVPLLYQENSAWRGDFQVEHGRFESKAVACDEKDPWPAEWPDDPQGSFDPYWYSFCLSYQ